MSGSFLEREGRVPEAARGEKTPGEAGGRTAIPRFRASGAGQKDSVVLGVSTVAIVAIAVVVIVALLALVYILPRGGRRRS